jgi:hypothetical protein
LVNCLRVLLAQEICFISQGVGVVRVAADSKAEVDSEAELDPETEADSLNNGY